MTSHAQLFVQAHPWAPIDHAEYIAAIYEPSETPFCYECADWHYPTEPHSNVENDQYKG